MAMLTTLHSNEKQEAGRSTVLVERCHKPAISSRSYRSIGGFWKRDLGLGGPMGLISRPAGPSGPRFEAQMAHPIRNISI